MLPRPSELGGLVPPFAELAGKSVAQMALGSVSKVSSRGAV